MMIICIKQHLSNILSSISEKIKQYCAWVEKKRCYKKNVYITVENPRFISQWFFLLINMILQNFIF